MNKNLALPFGLGILALILLALLFRERKKTEAQQAIIDAQQAKNKALLEQQKKMQQYIQQLQTLISNLDIPLETRKELNELVSQFQHTNEDIAGELASALAIIDAKQYSAAAEKFAKILENILKKQFENDTDFDTYVRGNGNRKDFATHIKYAKQQNLLNAAEQSFIDGLRLTRNGEAHELNNEQRHGKNWFLGSLHLGISLICRLSARFNIA